MVLLYSIIFVGSAGKENRIIQGQYLQNSTLMGNRVCNQRALKVMKKNTCLAGTLDVEPMQSGYALKNHGSMLQWSPILKILLYLPCSFREREGNFSNFTIGKGHESKCIITLLDSTRVESLRNI